MSASFPSASCFPDQPTMEEMQGMLKLLAQDRWRREDEITTEKARRKDEFAKE